ncbi:hypothetical protein LTR36_005708 [Oleoguttula mirabilis]|uniref:F-box domain-containing protein n=1 Tax=Oleoguttula mirabilis TaxID=1507867 RepID=A0AAV9JDX3_9PEZI|nr:hypothetical protein LTR36_005708 [Oleoguttula mirabilis]
MAASTSTVDYSRVRKHVRVPHWDKNIHHRHNAARFLEMGYKVIDDRGRELIIMRLPDGTRFLITGEGPLTPHAEKVSQTPSTHTQHNGVANRMEKSRLLKLPLELREAINQYLLPSPELELYCGMHTRRIRAVNTRDLNCLLSTCRQVRQEALEAVSRLNVTIGVEILAPPHTTRDMLDAFQNWSKREGSTLWPRVKKLTIGLGCPAANGWGASMLLPMYDVRDKSFPWRALRDLLVSSAVASGDLRLRLRTINPRPGLPRYTDISVKNIKLALHEFQAWVEGTESRASGSPAYLKIQERLDTHKTCGPALLQRIHYQLNDITSGAADRTAAEEFEG